jgi:hypothetical protein
VVEQEASLLTRPETEIVCVRFGNVLGSRGSMLPLFLEQIPRGTAADGDPSGIFIRYFHDDSRGGEPGVPCRGDGQGRRGDGPGYGRAGEDLRFRPAVDHLLRRRAEQGGSDRPASRREKLYEELLANKDTTMPTDNKKVFKAKVTGTLSENWLKENTEDDTY